MLVLVQLWHEFFVSFFNQMAIFFHIFTGCFSNKNRIRKIRFIGIEPVAVHKQGWMCVKKFGGMKKVISKLKSRWLHLNVKKLSDDSTVHGLKELYYSKSTVWKGIWIVIMTAATGLTAYQVGKSVQQYKDQPTITTIQPLDEGKLLYPPFSICYLHWSSWVDWKKVESLNISKSALYFGLSYLDKIFSQDLFELSTAEENFKHIMIQNNWTLLNEFYLAIAEDYPKSLSPDNDDKTSFTDKGFYDLVEICPFCYSINGKDLSDAYNNLSTSLRNANLRKMTLSIEKQPKVSFNSYLKAEEYAAYIKYMLKDEYTFFKPATTSEIITLFNPHLLVPNLASDIIKVNSDVETYRIKLKASVHKWQAQGTVHCMEGKKSNDADVSCETRCTAYMAYNACTVTPFEAAYLFQADTPLTTCKRNINFMGRVETKENWTRVEEAYFYCQCLTNGSQEDNNELKACLRGCYDGCEKWTYDVSLSFTTDQSSLKDFAHRQYTSIEVEYPPEDSIFVISEINSQSWESFVANVGGLLGIWLGASIVSFIQTIYLCCFTEHDEQEQPISKSATEQERNAEIAFYAIRKKRSAIESFKHY